MVRTKKICAAAVFLGVYQGQQVACKKLNDGAGDLDKEAAFLRFGG